MTARRDAAELDVQIAREHVWQILMLRYDGGRHERDTAALEKALAELNAANRALDAVDAGECN